MQFQVAVWSHGSSLPTRMANEEHLTILRQGPEPWNEWRDSNPEVQPDFRNADLHETDLSRANLERAILIDADLRQACLKDANLQGANLRRADLRETNLQGANLHRATLAKSDLRDANLKEADAREADMRESLLPGAVLDGADLKGAVLNKEGFRYVSLHNDQLKAAAAVSNDGCAASASPASSRVSPVVVVAKSRTSRTVLGAGVVLVLAGFAGFWLLSPSDGLDPEVPQAVADAVAGQGGVDSVRIEGHTLILHTGHRTLESQMYVDLLKRACRAVSDMESTNALREIRITNQNGEEGWIYDAPEQCGEILTKPASLTSLSIAAHTKPIRN